MYPSPTRPKAALARRCFIHIGTPKTGSTSLQAFLAANRVSLEEAGIFIPHSAGTGDPDSASHHAVASDLLDEPPGTNGGLQSVLSELAGSDAPHSCISSENFSLLYDRPELLTRLRDGIIAAGFAPVIVVYVRPQVSYATSVFGLNVLNGYRTSFVSFLRDVREKGSCIWTAGYGPQFDYVKLLDGFAAVFEPQTIVVMPFSSDAPDSFLHRSFIKAILPQIPFERFAVPPKRANRTLTFSGLLQMLGAANDFDQHLRFAPFRVQDIYLFWRRFALVNRRLHSRYGVKLPVFEIYDLVRALPFRRSLKLTRQLARARRALRDFD